MKLCDVTFCDFLIWREQELLVTRVYMDEEFLVNAIAKATHSVLPELLGKWYTKEAVCIPIVTDAVAENRGTSGSVNIISQTTDINATAGHKKWCYCNKEESGKIIACDSDWCPIQWFHTRCLKIHRVPKGKWYCPEC